MDEIDQLRRQIFELETRCKILQEGLSQALKASQAAASALSGQIAMLQIAITEILRASSAPQMLVERVRADVQRLMEDQSDEPNDLYERELTRTLAALLAAVEPPST